MLPAQPPPENEQFIEEDHQKEEQAVKEVDSKSHSEVQYRCDVSVYRKWCRHVYCTVLNPVHATILLFLLIVP